MEKLVRDLSELLERKSCENIKFDGAYFPEIGFFYVQWDFRITCRHDTPTETFTDRIVHITMLGSKIALIIYDYKGDEFKPVFKNVYEWHDTFVSILEKKLIDSWPDTDHHRTQY